VDCFQLIFLKSGCLSLSKRGRVVSKECEVLLSKFGGEFPAVPEKVVSVLEALGYSVEIVSKPGFPEYLLRYHRRRLILRGICKF
jgi:hypothetical protein